MQKVEAVLSQHPGVSGNVVVGVPDSRMGEMVVACIQLKGNWQWDDLSSNPSANYLSGDILRCFCKEKQLTGYVCMYVFTSSSVHCKLYLLMHDVHSFFVET